MAAHPVTEPQAPPRAPLIGWRLLALFYDLWPVAAVWLAISAVFTFGYFFAGHGERENIAPFSALAWLLWISCWLVTGAYAVASWRRGGQTLGMRPWRLRVVDATGAAPTPRAAMLRFVAGTASLLCAGAGFWWAWFDRDGLTWHDRLSGTRMHRLPKR